MPVADQEQVIRQLADELADMRRRIAALETAPRATMTSVRGGYTRWQVDTEPPPEYPKLYIGAAGSNDGDVALVLRSSEPAGPEVYVGTVNDAAGVSVELDRAKVSAWNDDSDAASPVLHVDGGQLWAPRLVSFWQKDPQLAVDANGRPITNSTSYVTMLSCWFPCVTRSLITNVWAQPGAGVTSMAVRLRGRVGANPMVTIDEETGITSATFVQFVAAIPESVGGGTSSPVGSLLDLIVEARVTGGTGNVNVAGGNGVIGLVS